MRFVSSDKTYNVISTLAQKLPVFILPPTQQQIWHETREGLYHGLIGLVGGLATAYLTAAAITYYLPQWEELSPTEVAPPGTPYLTIDGKQVAYREMGTGETPIVLLHGFGCDLQTWADLQPALASHYRTVALDLWGFGASARQSHLVPRDWVREVMGVMDALDIHDAVLIGHSMGGRVAMMCAASCPTRVRALSLLDCDGLDQRILHPVLETIMHTPMLRLTLRRLRHHPRSLTTMLQQTYGSDYPISRELVLRYVRPLLVRGTETCWDHLGRYYPESSTEQLVTEINCPVQLIWGTRDRIAPLSHAIRIAEALPGCDFQLIGNAYHHPHEEYPEVVYAHLMQFLRRQENISGSCT